MQDKPVLLDHAFAFIHSSPSGGERYGVHENSKTSGIIRIRCSLDIFIISDCPTGKSVVDVKHPSLLS